MRFVRNCWIFSFLILSFPVYSSRVVGPFATQSDAYSACIKNNNGTCHGPYSSESLGAPELEFWSGWDTPRTNFTFYVSSDCPNGINHQQFADMAGLTLSQCHELLIQETPEPGQSTQEFFLRASCKDSLIVWDEIQDTFPSDRNKLSPEWSKYIASHRHEGQDIILMGQDKSDIHKIWRNRIESVVYFTKLTAIGKPNGYKWEKFQKQGRKFVKTASGTRNYENQYFGLYQSHTQGTVNKDVYTDSRTNVFTQGWGFKFGLPLFFVGFCYSIYHLFGFFQPPEKIKPAVSAQKIESIHPIRKVEPVVTVTEKITVDGQAVAVAPVKTAEPLPSPTFLDYFDKMASEYRLRISGLVTGIKNGEEYKSATFELLSNTHHRQEVFTSVELVHMGWNVDFKPYGVEISKDDKMYLARSWPLDRPGRVSADTRASLSRS